MYGSASAYDRDKLLRQMQRERAVERVAPVSMHPGAPASFVDRVLSFLDEYGDSASCGQPSSTH